MLQSHKCGSADGRMGVWFLLLRGEHLVSGCLDCWGDLAGGWRLGCLFQGAPDVFRELLANFWLHGSSVCHNGLLYYVTAS